LDFISKKEYIKNELIANQGILDEIDEINPKPGEDLELERELKLSENSELINSLLFDVLSELVEENSINNKLINVKKKLETLSKYEESFVPFNEEINEHIPFFKELGDNLRRYFDNLEFQPQKIDEINQRLFNLNKLKRKYGTIEEILQKKSDLELFILKYTESPNSRNVFEDNLAEAFNNVYKCAHELSIARKDKLQQFEEEFLKTIQLLGFQHIEFLTNLKTNNFEPKFDLNKISQFTSNGIDHCEFLISTNLGEKPKELSKIASGGELSRIILSLKSLAAADKNLPILVFDEIDSGVSGRIAQKVGELMKNLSKNHQLICITHSPQIAAAGESVISIEKIEKNGRMISIARQLNQNEIKMEIAKFLSGANVSDSSLLTAEDLIKNYKN
jgi:DNA repair protein RecN (Recombination protein N)